ncbi:MAG: MerR family transcriptional regulator [Flavobacteriales bacterium]|uniref:MerR family transcriptional regulator n=1 Tax=Sanyastnella coralliicola TaxID=3069118 RepID=UPI0027B98E98|nr:MerR family transcriptional regulator [Longitalea sp. SCSIO 12813]MCH2197650.1 MerR family transcriptional regulator [Flavobacteriales bacterium]
MPYREKEIEKQYFTISEVAGMFDVNASLIRFWEREFDAIKPKKNKKGNRLFTRKDLETIRTIHHLVKERGFTLEGARKHLKAKPKEADRDAEVAGRLQQIRAFLIELKEQL